VFTACPHKDERRRRILHCETSTTPRRSVSHSNAIHQPPTNPSRPKHPAGPAKIPNPDAPRVHKTHSAAQCAPSQPRAGCEAAEYGSGGSGEGLTGVSPAGGWAPIPTSTASCPRCTPQPPPPNHSP
jgi:hypothetical protein